MQRHWQAVTEADPAAAKGYFGYVLAHMARAFVGDARGLVVKSAARTDRAIKNVAARRFVAEDYEARWSEVVALLDAGLAMEATPERGQMVEWTLEFVFGWAQFPKQLGRAEAAARLPVVFAVYPEMHAILGLGMLRNHPAPLEVAEDILTSFVQKQRLDVPAVSALAARMIGMSGVKDDPVFQGADQVLAAVLDRVGDLDAEAFVAAFVVRPLDLDHPSRDEALGQLRQFIAENCARSETVEDSPSALMPAWMERDLAAKALARYEAELARIEGDYDGDFADFGLKLLVIEELMYRQKILTPMFDLEVFASEHLERQIDVDVDGYAPLPEAAKYFKDTHFPADFLAKVTRLHQSSGADGGPAYMAQYHRFWDPGAGDGPVKVGAKAAHDLHLLPNLARISGLEHSAPKGPLLKALAAAGIEVVTEGDA